MKKFLQILKISLIIILILGSIGGVICYLIIPETVKLLIDDIIVFLNQPLPVVGVSLIVVLSFIYKIFVSSKYGQKQINKFKEEVDEEKQKYIELLDKVNSKKDEYQSLINAHQSEIDFLESFIVKLCETSTNVKIKALADDLKNSYESKKNAIACDLDSYKSQFMDVYNQIKNYDLDELKKQLEDKFNELKEELNNYGNNEKEEKVNNSSEEE